MKKTITHLIVAVLSLIIVLPACTNKSSTPEAAKNESKTLNIYCWANYFSPDVVKKFEEQTHIKVNFDYFSSNEEMLAKLQAGARGYDLIVPSSYMLKALKELKLIQPIGAKDWPEAKKLAPRFANFASDPNREFSVPYSWGTTGIAVNKAKLKDKVDSWAWLFDHPELAGKITMLDDAPAVIGSALKYLGYSYNEGSDEAFTKVKALLAKQKKNLKAYTAEAQPVIASGEVAIAQVYSGDAEQVRTRKNPNIEYVYPKEGGEIFVDNFAIPVGAISIENAKEFIKFTLSQEVALAQVQHLFFGPVVDLSGFKGAESIVASKTILPSNEILSKFEVMTENPERMEKIQRIWTELKSM